MASYIAFKGIKSTDMELSIQSIGSEQISTGIGEYIEVPGRDGYLYIDKGYKAPISRTVRGVIHPRDKAHLDAIKNWLRGSGELILSTEPDVFYNSRIQEIIDYQYPYGSNLEITVDMVFNCQPQRYYLSGKNPISLTSSPATLYNPGAISKPTIKITGTGTVLMSINSQSIQATVDGYLTIDSELMECYKDNELKTFTGPFPELIEGVNNISWYGTVTEVEVIPKWRK